ncbi:MAG: glutamine synthetase [Hydrogenophilales bacterium CG03_land_8_20_14_0_80_62_28]|nr:glutamate--ammonia ligase [Betaproteobacteria bacterium]OIO77278.1 MAG: type I glutamate--ammonia ligase [Hydrogenophilaceae bacterium CG1_02_62_390]PIV21402.1 MAG: glutamine synthetase [Hydrogenophilales bacterium CG03_land_8_20_14_0_80_62_28]PIW38248.1 MAG: glutamine synthetase [Hydrogenophilales bacterium CG15_BIG_FIL_POST_REV_8_21_14_020_62_31]PIW71842.1 MAG: glutamine synthetase [Hydrogenophilales bacterium CG12_big_fil_rev_8_21_14_0_65_61_21]PIX01878.1 MAG: glutamine synthetase [Hydro
MAAADVMKMVQENDIKFVDFRFTDTHGKEQHVSVPVSAFDEDKFSEGHAFDGSSIAGWKGIQASDMLLMPDPDTANIDPFMDEPTLILTCDVIEPDTGKGYDRDPRSIAKRAEAYLKSTGVGDTVYFGPEPEFFIFDSVTWADDMSGCHVKIHSEEAAWSSGEQTESGNIGHRPKVKGGYFPVPPIDSLQDIRSAMCLAMEDMGVPVEVHHHEVATAGQCEIGTRFAPLTQRADWTQILKYVVHNVAHAYGKTATFMPKPIVGDNGSGMHCHQSIWKDGKNLFAGNGYAGLSETALYYIGGIIKHAHALNALTNPGTNSYKRLVPGFEAPVMLAYSARNRSASIRIPHVSSDKARRIEVRFPDPIANPYLAFTAMMMAGLDGIQNKIHPGDPATKNLYDLPPEEEAKIPTVCHSLDMALDALDKDREFLTKGGVFSNDFIDAYIALKMEEVTRMRMTTHPIEFDMYYSV